MLGAAFQAFVAVARRRIADPEHDLAVSLHHRMPLTARVDPPARRDRQLSGRTVTLSRKTVNIFGTTGLTGGHAPLRALGRLWLIFTMNSHPYIT
jgi:hypothetical protein